MEFYIFLLCMALIVVAANVEERRQRAAKNKPGSRTGFSLLWLLLNGLIAFVFVLQLVMIYMTLNAHANDIFRLEPHMVQTAIVMCTIGVALSLAVVNNTEARLLLERLLKSHDARYNGATEPLFNPGSLVHKAAIVLIMVWLTLNMFNFVAAGGLQGMAADYTGETSSVSQEPPPPMTEAEAAAQEKAYQEYEAQANASALFELGQMLVIWIAFACIGVGIFVRRTPGEVMKRLGLRIPTLMDVTVGLLMGLLLYILVFAFSTIVSLVTPPEIQAVQDAASAAAVAPFTQSVLLWFLMACQAGIGEEIFFRGALQPIFGGGLVALLFALTHSQYMFTPSWFVIFAIGIAFAWLRRRFSTTSAIIAHAMYDFMPVIAYFILPGIIQSIGR